MDRDSMHCSRTRRHGQMMMGVFEEECSCASQDREQAAGITNQDVLLWILAVLLLVACASLLLTLVYRPKNQYNYCKCRPSRDENNNLESCDEAPEEKAPKHRGRSRSRSDNRSQRFPPSRPRRQCYQPDLSPQRRHYNTPEPCSEESEVGSIVYRPPPRPRESISTHWARPLLQKREHWV